MKLFGRAWQNELRIITPVFSFTCINIYTIIDVGAERAGKFLFQVSTVAQRRQTEYELLVDVLVR